MRVANVILWRHGQTDYNAEGRVQGQVDIPLNRTGVAQASAAARVLARIKPAAIITSDLSRAADTARALADIVGIDAAVDERLRERAFGDWEGLNREEIQRGWPEEFDEWRKGGHPEGVNAESRTDLGERFSASINEWASRFEISDTLIFVTHGAAISTGITALLGQDPDGWRGISGLSNCHWSTLEPHAGDPAWKLLRHNVGP